MKLHVIFRFLIAISLVLIVTGKPAYTISASVDTGLYLDLNAQAGSPESQDAGPNKIYLPAVTAPGSTSSGVPSWPMVAANLERTSWTPTEVRGSLTPRWYKPIEPYISPKVQVIAADNTLFISSSRGLYALDATTGAEKWVYPTELPLGNSPTISGGIAYVGGMDSKLYAINTANGQRVWSFQAGAGFDTNPVVIGDKVYAGNRDGLFYAIHTTGVNRGKAAWTFPTEGAIHLSAAYKDGVLFFASDDMHAYALNAQNGAQVWKSDKLPGSGFNSWWPVIYQNYVVFSGSSAYRMMLPPGDLVTEQHQVEGDCLFPNGHSSGLYIGSKISNELINATKAANCLETLPWIRTYIVLDRFSGNEVTFDFDGDGKTDYAPILWHGPRGGSRYPPVIGSTGLLYQTEPYVTDQYSFRGQVSGWQFGTSNITTPAAITIANDEPMAYSAGGNLIYWTHCCDRSSGAFDLSKPNPGYVDNSREWRYYDEGGLLLSNLIPGYNEMYYSEDINTVYGNGNGEYGLHGDQSPPIPYNGKVYMVRSNAVVAFSSSGGSPAHLPTASIQSATTNVSSSVDALKFQLAQEVQEMLNAGHLRPGYGISGNFDLQGRFDCGEYMLDYFHDPSESIYTLLRALPYLPIEMQASTRNYIQSELTNFTPYRVVHIGWAQGASRDAFDLPPDVDSGRAEFQASAWLNFGLSYWQFQPHLYYTLWKYAQAFPGSAKDLFDEARANAPLASTPSNDLLAQKPFVHNSFIAGYIGYLNLQEMAGYTRDSGKQAELNRLLSLRAANFSKNNPYAHETGLNYCMTTTVSRNFQYMTPELGQYLHDNAYNKVLEAVNEYNVVEPYWFVSNFEATYAEGVHQPLQDVIGMFQAKGLILQQSFEELVKYLDAPAFAVGDLYHMQNLVTAIEAGL